MAGNEVGSVEDPAGGEREPQNPSRKELARLADESGDTTVVAKAPKWPVPATKAEKRAERSVALWFILSALSAIAFVVTFSVWPQAYVSPFQDGYLWTPQLSDPPSPSRCCRWVSA